jgi:hypothetical protein
MWNEAVVAKFGSYSGIYPDGLRKITKKKQCPSRYLNPEPAKYEGVLIIRPWRSVARPTFIFKLQSVHCAGLSDVQNILSADTVVSPCNLKVIHSVTTWSASQSVLRSRVIEGFIVHCYVSLWLVWVNVLISLRSEYPVYIIPLS